jgi:membrane protein implicated in regulation of membrane protease activity
LRVTYADFTRLGWRGWVGIIVGGAIAFAAAIALVILSLGLALVLIPVVAAAALWGRWRLRQMTAAATKQAAQPGAGKTIEIEYSVVGEDGDRRP